MLVFNGDRNGLGKTERTVIGWMRNWTGLAGVSGVVISGCVLPGRANGAGGTEADLVVFTPHTVVVIEVKGIVESVSGDLSCPSNGPWSMAEIIGSPVHVRRRDINPFDQVSAAVFGVKDLAKRLGIDAYVFGLVLVLPMPNCTLTLSKGVQREGLDVLVGLESQLKQWFLNRCRRPGWTAEQAHRVISELNFDYAVTVADLVDEGFVHEAATREEHSGVACAPPPRAIVSDRALQRDDDFRLTSTPSEVSWSDRAEDVFSDDGMPWIPQSRFDVSTPEPRFWEPIAARYRSRTPPFDPDQQTSTVAPPPFASPSARPLQKLMVSAAAESAAAVVLILVCGVLLWLLVRHNTDAAPAGGELKTSVSTSATDTIPPVIGSTQEQRSEKTTSPECFPLQSC
ncbi:nuclease-related domain-containing protein [Nocardia salmonicida]|uniref:nuclease-related domain-containing protein n=1 Tax=Nocardia salmonicida TaxID=53431 RepID=UPI0033E88F4C